MTAMRADQPANGKGWTTTSTSRSVPSFQRCRQAPAVGHFLKRGRVEQDCAVGAADGTGVLADVDGAAVAPAPDALQAADLAVALEPLFEQLARVGRLVAFVEVAAGQFFKRGAAGE